MNLTKRTRCFFRLNSSWAQCSAVCMGLSVFIRIIFYFGITDFNDLTPFLLAFHVILPTVLAAGFLIMLRGLRFNSPILLGALSILFAVNCLLITDRNGSVVISAVLMIVTGAILIVTGMGVLPTRWPLLVAAAAALLYRVIAIDWNMYIHAPAGFHLLAYLPQLSNLFGLLAILALCPSMRLLPLQRHMVPGSVPEKNQAEQICKTSSEESPDAILPGSKLSEASQAPDASAATDGT